MILEQQMKRAKPSKSKKTVRSQRVSYSLSRKKKAKADLQHTNGDHANGGDGILHEDVTAFL